MRDARSGDGDVDRRRLRELAAVVDADDVEAQRERVQTIVNESIDLYGAKAWRTIVRMFDVVEPAMDALGAATRDAQTSQLVSWTSWSYAHALMIVGRTDEAMTRTKDGFARLDASWPDAERLRNNYGAILNDRLCGLINQKDYGKAIEVYAAYRDACRADRVCAGNVAVAYGNSSIDAQNAGDWQSARRALQQCVGELPDNAPCRDALADLESRHRF
jgi:Tfp pilus assembly protein PilF